MKEADIKIGDPSLWDFHLLKEGILNAVNKDLHSKTFGCCDRLYWGWKLKDFPDLTKQYSLYAFGLLIDERSEYDAEVFRSMVLFWMRYLNRDGSADQCFPGEKSAGPTLYALHAILSSYDKILKYFKKEEIGLLSSCIKKSLFFSVKHQEEYGFIANHRALFAHTYLLADRLFSGNNYHKFYEREINIIRANFQEGWFKEYESADPGYQTQCLHYLTLCFKDTSEAGIKEMILDSIKEFMAYFIFPDGSFAGALGGRATEMFYPYSFMYWQAESKVCNEIVNFLYRFRGGKSLVKWYALDYENFIRLGTNYLLSESYYRQTAPVSSFNILPHLKNFKKEWKSAGLLIHSDPHKYMAINSNRGGIFKIVSKKNDGCIEDTGFVINSAKLKYSSSIFNPEAYFEIIQDEAIVIKTNFHKILESYLDVPAMIAIRLLSLSLFRFPLFAALFKKRVAHELILRKKSEPFSLVRVITNEGDTVTIQDTIEVRRGAGRLRPLVCSLNSKSVPFHMASSGYFHEGKLNHATQYDIRGLELKDSLRLETKVTFGNDKIYVDRDPGGINCSKK